MGLKSKLLSREPPCPAEIPERNEGSAARNHLSPPLSQSRTWKDSLDVPCHHTIEEGVKQHHGDGSGEIEAIFLHRALKEVVPLHPNTLLLKKSKVLTAKSKSHRREQALRERGKSYYLFP